MTSKLSFDDDSDTPILSNQPTKKTAPTGSRSGIGLDKSAPLVGKDDTMADIHQKLVVASKNDRDAIHASTRERDLLMQMLSAKKLREQNQNLVVSFREGKDPVNLLASRVRAISSDGESIEIDLDQYKHKNRLEYLRSVGKLPPEQTEIEKTKSQSKKNIEFEED